MFQAYKIISFLAFLLVNLNNKKKKTTMMAQAVYTNERIKIIKIYN